MPRKKPCCATEAARTVKKLTIGGTPVGISQLDQIIEEVLEMDLVGETEINNAHLKMSVLFSETATLAFIPCLKARVFCCFLRIKRELLKRVKIYNYVSPGSEEDYANALFAEYKSHGGIND